MIKYVLLSTVTLVSVIGLFSLPVKATDDFYICHATHSDVVNPFVKESPDENSIVKGNAHDEHQDAEDIIPPFTYEANDRGTTTEATYPGRNWDAAGQKFWTAGCVVVDEDDSDGGIVAETKKTYVCHYAPGQDGKYVHIEVSVNAADENPNYDGHASHANDLIGDEYKDSCPIDEIVNENPLVDEPGKGDFNPKPVVTDKTPVSQPVAVTGAAEALPYTAGDHTLAYTLIAAGLATIVTGVLIGGNVLYRRIS